MQKLQDGLMYDEKRERIVLVGREMGKSYTPLRRSCHGNTRDHSKGKPNDKARGNSSGSGQGKPSLNSRTGSRGSGKKRRTTGSDEGSGS